MTAVEYLVDNFTDMKLIPIDNKHVKSIIMHAIEMEKEQVKSSTISTFEYPKINGDIKKIINKKFKGNIDDVQTLHANSICRIAFVGYLRSLGYSNHQIAKMTGWKTATVRHRIFKHREAMKFDVSYKSNFKEIMSLV